MPTGLAPKRRQKTNEFDTDVRLRALWFPLAEIGESP